MFVRNPKADKMYVIVYRNFFKFGVTNSPQRRIKEISRTFGTNINLEKSVYFEVPEELVYTIEKKVKDYFDVYKGSESFKTECFRICDLENFLNILEKHIRLENVKLKKVHFYDEVVIFNEEFSGKPMIKGIIHLYHIYKLVMNNKETLDELFLERLTNEKNIKKLEDAPEGEAVK